MIGPLTDEGFAVKKTSSLGRGSGPTRDVSRKELTMHLQQCIVDTRKCVNNAL